MSEDDWIPRWKMDSYALQRELKQQDRKEKKREKNMRFLVTAEDLAKGRVVSSAGWFPIDILKVEEVKSAKGVAGTKVSAMVLGPDQDKGIQVMTQFWENAPGFIVPFMAALGVKVEAGKDYDLTNSTLRGKKMEWFIARGEYNGKPTNDVQDYRPMGSGAAA